MEIFYPIVCSTRFFRARARVYKCSVIAFTLLFGLFSAVSAANPAFDQALQSLKSPDLKTKYAARPALQASRSVEAADALAQAALSEKDVNFRLAVLDQLAGLGYQRVIPAIAGLLRSDNAEIRKRTAKVIGILGGPNAEKALLDAAKREKDAEVKAALLQGLSLCGSEQSVQALQDALNDKRPEVRANAVGALHRIPGKKSRKALERARGDKDKQIQKLAEDSLKKRSNE
jgi:HEAT repeat protein